MKTLFVYVDGGKGHYIPAVTIKTELDRLGMETFLEEFFVLLDIRWLGKINKFFWRTMLRMSRIENHVSKAADGDRDAMKHAVRYGIKHCTDTLMRYIAERDIDCIFTTHPYAGTVISAMLKKQGSMIPVYYFATDVFSAPIAAISNDLRRFYIATAEGAEAVKRMGMRNELVEVSPFPLQQNVAESPHYTKSEARARLGLVDMFTLQLNLGGEGLGSLALIHALAKTDRKIQIVVIGGLDRRMRKKLEALARILPGNIRLVIVGFVNNVNEYLYAADIVAGRSGINTLLEAFYAHRPFLITELVYTVMQSATYVVEHGLGWNCNRDCRKQAEIVLSCVDDPAILDDMDRNFNCLPIEFDARKFAGNLIKDYDEYMAGKKADGYERT